MRSSLRASSILALAGAALLVVAAGYRAEDKPDGGSVFKQRCSMCHGAEGKGFAAIKTPDLTDPKWQDGITDEKMVETIKNGKKGTAMPAFADKLKEDEIQAVIAYIRSLNSAKKK